MRGTGSEPERSGQRELNRTLSRNDIQRADLNCCNGDYHRRKGAETEVFPSEISRRTSASSATLLSLDDIIYKTEVGKN